MTREERSANFRAIGRIEVPSPPERHLKAVFLKTGTRSQAQLARLLAELPPEPIA